MGTTETATAGPAFRGKALVAGLALALLVSVGTVTGAGAERPPSGGDSHQQACRSIYDAAARLRDEYLQVALMNPGSPRLDEIIAEGRVLGQDWLAAKCNERYGSIAHLVVGPFDPATDPGIVADPGVVADPGQDIVADPGVVADPGIVTEIIVPGDEAGEVVLDDSVPGQYAEIIEVGDEEGVVVIDDPVPAPVEDEQP